jgi:hypothetical protein
LFSRAATNFGIANKSTVLCSGAQRKVLDLRPKALYFVQPRSDKFRNCEQKHCTCTAAQRKVLELRPKALHFVQPRSEIAWNCEQNTVFCSAAQRIFLELRTKQHILVSRTATKF